MNNIMTKSSKDSFLSVFHQDSHRASNVFSPNPRMYERPVEVIQVMPLQNGELFVEYLFLDKEKV